MWQFFKSELQKLMLDSIPCKVTNTKSQTKPKPVWLNDSVMKKLQSKNVAFQTFLNIKDERDYTIYKKERKELKTATRRAIRQYEKEIAEQAKRKPKIFFRYLHSKTNMRSRIVRQ